MEVTRILHLVGTMKQRYGVTSFLMNFYRNIERDKIQFDFLIYNDTEKHIIDEIRNLGGKTYLMPTLSIKSAGIFIKYINSFFCHNDIKYNVIHSHFHQVESIIFPIAKKNGTRICISHSHSTRYSESKIRAIRNWLMCLPLKKNATHYFACSKDAGKFLFGKNNLELKKVVIIRNAIDCTKFRYNIKIREEMRAKLQLQDKIIFGNVGSFKTPKNHIFLVDVFNEILKLNEEARLVLVGGGELEIQIRNRIREYGIMDKVILEGIKNNVEQYYQAFDCLLFPSKFEGLGIVLIEAQVSGLSVVASDVIPEEARVIENIEYLSLMLTPKQWAEKALQIVEKSERRDRYEEIKNANYDLRDEAKRLYNIYKKLEDS